MADKKQFLSRVVNTVVTLATLQEYITGLSGVYIARGYMGAGADPITDTDLANAGISLTAEQFNTVVVPLLGDYLNFCNNIAVPAKDRKVDMNKARSDI